MIVREKKKRQIMRKFVKFIVKVVLLAFSNV